MKKKRRQPSHDIFDELRRQMVEQQLLTRDIVDKRVLAAMRKVPRHEFVSRKRQMAAYDDGPLAIGEGQTISQPYVVASMTQSLALPPNGKVLEIGTGCGYQAAILSELCQMVCTVEIIPELQERAQATLRTLGYKKIRIQLSDGTIGWPVEAPFDGIIVTAAAPVMPEHLIEQLRVGGRMVLPLVSDRWGRQFLHLITRTTDGYDDDELYEVRFVPMVGEIEGT